MKINGFDILYVCDTGSRAKGLNSPSSDHDLWCIFRQPIEDYVKLNTYKSDFLIEDIHTLNLNLDFTKSWKQEGSLQAMNIKKFCELLYKSNPTAIEMCITPIVHYGIYPVLGQERLKQLSNEYFNPLAGAMHYHSLAKSNYRKYVVDEKDATIKRYLNILRGLDNHDYIIKNRTIPPMNYEECIISHTVKSYYDNIRELLIHLKRKGINTKTNIPELNSIIEERLELPVLSDELNISNRDPKHLNDFLWEALNMKTNNSV